VKAVAAVPAKDFGAAKQRLGARLGAAERAALARAMLEDVLDAVCAASFQTVLVVTRDPEVEACVSRFPVEVLREESSRGHTAAVALAQAAAVARGADAFVTVPGDVPEVTPAELRAMLEAGRVAAAVFVPSASGVGTNGALLRPPAALPLTFGEPSFAGHLAAARRHELVTAVLRLPGLGLDIDTPDDLAALGARGSRTRSGRLLARLEAGGRLAAGG
jgi:2-phospho-L-lactate/phosphoenolpyruvate guanylyltransferase